MNDRDDTLSIPEYWEKHKFDIANMRHWACQKYGCPEKRDNCECSCKLWEERYQRGNTLKTYSKYVANLTPFLTSSISEVTLFEIRDALICVKKSRKGGKPYSHSTMKVHFSCLCDIFLYAKKHGHADNILAVFASPKKMDPLTMRIYELVDPQNPQNSTLQALEELHISSPQMLLEKCLGLSLSDQYWICPEGSGLTWEKVNFFNNGFSDDIGNVLFGSNKKPSNPLDFSSPDNTSDGNLKKRWKIIDGKRCLVKGGSKPFRQQPLNEVIATEIMERLDIPHVPYTVTWNKGAPYSICEDFIDENTELIPAWRIIQTQKQDNSTSLYQHFLNCCNALGIPGAEEFLDRMITLDYIIANEDRHLNNFGAIRNAETLEWIGMAPIYDSGSSLGYDKITPTMKNAREYTCKPFKKHHEEQLKLVSSFDWVDFAKLSDVQEIITSILSDENATDYMDETRIRVIAELTERRIRNIESLAMSHTRVQSITTEDDVEEDIAEDYGPKMEM